MSLPPDDPTNGPGVVTHGITSVSVQFHIFGGNNGAGADEGRCAVSGVALSF